MKNNYLFYVETINGEYTVINNLSKTKAAKLYKEALKDFPTHVKSCGWEEVLNPLSLSQQIKFQKGGIPA